MTRPIIDSYVKDARIELQGDLRDKVEELPEEIEFNPVFAGGESPRKSRKLFARHCRQAIHKPRVRPSQLRNQIPTVAGHC